MIEYLQHVYDLSLDAAPYLVFGLLLAGLMKAWLPEAFLHRQLGSPGMGSVIKAALLGAPMPLCSCGVLPVAMNLHRSGASKGATVSFLVATPETGVDSISLSYGLLGPVLTIARPIAAITNAIAAGLLTGWRETSEHTSAPSAAATTSCCATAPSADTKNGSDACAGKAEEEHSAKSCCAATPKPVEKSCCASGEASAPQRSTWKDGLHYTFGQLLDDMLPWLLAGILFAAAIQTFVPTQWLTEWGKGPLAMIVMVLIGVPMYICASASTPIAAGFLLAGVSPGTVLVFLLAGPATNIAAVGLIHKELGRRALISYLSSVVVISIAFGILLDYLIGALGLNLNVSEGGHTMLIPHWLAALSLLALIIAAIKPLRKRVMTPLLAG